jgi:lipopolysaccharide export system protein LptA
MRLAYAIVLLFCFSFLQLRSQSKQEEIELLHADKFGINKYTPKGANKLKGSVRLQHQNALMFCDSALLFDNNSVKAEGNVRIVESDSLTLVGDSLFYDGNTKIAKFRSNVIIDNGSSVLKTDYLDYDRSTGIGAYYSGGEIDSKQEGIHLTSERGYYFTESKVFHYKTDVVMTHPDYTIYTDTMHYSSDLEKTWFYGPTHIEFEDRDIFCEYGWFDQLADRANFIRNAKILSSGQILKGDTIDYDQKAQIGISKCNVVVIDTSQKFEVNGDYAIYYEADSVSFVSENMIMKQDMNGDTFFLVADTLHSFIDSCRHERIIKTYHNTRFFKEDMQGQCDSLVYLTADSIIHMFHDPILWSDNNQITADSIQLTMANGTMDKMYMNQTAFIIAHEDSIFYNQIKGINMIGYFKDAELSKVDVFGNGQTVYYPREEDQTLIGVNETKCSNMTIKIDSSAIKKISFYDRPTAKLTPTDEMPATGLQLDGFNWRINERPGSVYDLLLGTSTPQVEKVAKVQKQVELLPKTEIEEEVEESSESNNQEAETTDNKKQIIDDNVINPQEEKPAKTEEEIKELKEKKSSKLKSKAKP